MLSIIGSVFLAMMVWGLINFIINTIRIRRMVKKYKDDPDVKGVHLVNGEIKVVPNKENESSENKEKENSKNKEVVNLDDLLNLNNKNTTKNTEENDSAIVDESKEMVVDSVCGCKVEKKEAFHIMRDNQSFYFCSWDCREKFLEE